MEPALTSDEEDDSSAAWQSESGSEKEMGARTTATAGSETPLSAKIGLPLGPGLAAAVIGLLALLSPEGLGRPAQHLAGVTFWMAAWWMTEAVPLGVTALLPLALFPPMHILKAAATAKSYSVPLIWLFFGGFQVAFALERTGLHKRIAFMVMRVVGTRPPCLILGMMLAVGTLSMFLSNTSTTLMILPVSGAITASFQTDDVSDTDDVSSSHKTFGKALMLGIAYAASTGGIGTIIGTPPNGVLAAQGEEFNLRINFANWMAFAVPLAMIMLLLIWLFLIVRFRVPRGHLPPDHPVRRALCQDLGPVSQAEALVSVIFALTVLAWMVRKPVVKSLNLEKGWFEDSTISVAAAIVLFIIPARGADGQVRKLMDWQTLLQTPWHILLLFGGGFALATAFKDTGLSVWLGSQLQGLSGLPPFVLVLLTVLLVTFLTEITSNTATANVLLPIVGELACAVRIAPALMMVPAALAASCAFMLPVATPPNAIVFATGKISMTDMASSGVWINFATALLITAWMFTWGQLWFDTSAADLASHCPA